MKEPPALKLAEETSAIPDLSGAPDFSEVVEGSSEAGLALSSLGQRSNVSELMIYEGIARELEACLKDFLLPLQTAPGSTFAFRALMLDEFLSKFIEMASHLADECCQKLVRIIRSHSRIATVRMAPTPELARRIRETCFKPQDTILDGCIRVTKKVQVVSKNTRVIRDSLSNGGPQEAAPAPVRAAGGGAASPDTQPKAWASQEELSKQEAKLMQLKAQAYSKMIEFIHALDELPGRVLSYAYDKCFAADVRFDLEAEQTAKIRLEIQSRRVNAIETLGRVTALTQEELQRAAAAFQHSLEEEKLHLALEKMAETRLEQKAKAQEKQKRILYTALVGALVLVVVCLGLLFLML